jgi:hypothetical protein
LAIARVVLLLELNEFRQQKLSVGTCQTGDLIDTINPEDSKNWLSIN